MRFLIKINLGTFGETDSDRLDCLNNYKKFIEKAKSGSPDHVVKGRRVNVYELVKDAYDVLNMSNNSDEKKDTINLQWENNRQKQ